VYRLVPVSQAELSQAQNKPKFLDPIQIHTPSLAIEAIQKEMDRFGKMTILYYKHANQAVLSLDSEKLAQLTIEKKNLHQLHMAILSYLGDLIAANESEKSNAHLIKMVGVMDIYESLLEVIDQAITDTGYQMIDHNIKPSSTMISLLENLVTEIESDINLAFDAFCSADTQHYQALLISKARVDELIEQALKHQTSSLSSSAKRIQTFRLEMQLIDGYKRLHTLSKRATRTLEKPVDAKQEPAPKSLSA
jgi:phosphate:Na+ symporter